MSDYAIRPLERTGDKAALESAFKVHLPQKSLDELQIRAGDFCCLHTPNGMKALGIAHLVSGASSGGKSIAKVTDLFRQIYDISLQDRVTISSSEDTRAQAIGMTIVAVDKAQRGSLQADFPDYTTLNLLALAKLVQTKSICAEGTFEVNSILRDRKRRFIVQEVQTTSSSSKVLSCTAHTKLTILDFDMTDQPTSASNHTVRPISQVEFKTDGIAGLDAQLKTLQRSIRRFTKAHSLLKSTSNLQRGSSILLTGPDGTGKTLTISKVEAVYHPNVHIVSAETLGSTVKEARTKLSDIFTKARMTTTPSLISIDEYETVFGEPGSARLELIKALATNLRSLQNSSVLCIAAAKSPKAVGKVLRSYDTFATIIELPVPDARARAAILETLLCTPRTDGLYEEIGDKTHGYVGRDLQELCITALENAQSRLSNSDPLLNNESSPQTIEQALIPADFLQALPTMRPSAMKEVFLETPKVRWSDIGGGTAVKDAMYKISVRPYKQPELVKHLNLITQRGILLYGPPGCSKTLTAQAVATEAGLPFLAVKGAELLNMYVGESERAIRDLFQKARSASPSVIFFDEIDSIAAASRGSTGSNGLNVVTTLLNEMDGIEAAGNVLVIGATNAPEALDPALLRPGRIDTILYVGPPDTSARAEIFKIKSRGRPLASDVDFAQLAQETDGHSGAEIAQICHIAAEEAATEWEAGDQTSKALITKMHFEVAMRKVPKQITGMMKQRYEMWAPGMVTKLL